MANQKARIKILRAKIEAGLPIGDSEWLAWQKKPGFAWPKRMKAERLPKLPPMPQAPWPPTFGTEEGGDVTAYLEAMGIKDVDDANPSAIYWTAFEALERGERCEACGRRGALVCKPCKQWERTLTDRQRIRRVTAA